MRISTTYARAGTLVARLDSMIDFASAVLPRVLLALYVCATAMANFVITGYAHPFYIDWTDGRAQATAFVMLLVSSLGVALPWAVLRRKQARNITIAIGLAASAMAICIFLGPDVPMLKWKNFIYVPVLALSLAGCASAVYVFLRTLPWPTHRPKTVYLRH